MLPFFLFCNFLKVKIIIQKGIVKTHLAVVCTLKTVSLSVFEP